jgi:Fe2+ transport system protein FeoA
MTPAIPSLRVSHLGRGDLGLVTAVDAPDDTVARLAALGLSPGTALRVIQGGSSVAVAVGASRLALGREWADALVVARL